MRAQTSHRSSGFLEILLLAPPRACVRKQENSFAMPLVRVRIYLGKSLLGEPTRPFAAEVTVKAVTVEE